MDVATNELDQQLSFVSTHDTVDTPISGNEEDDAHQHLHRNTHAIDQPERKKERKIKTPSDFPIPSTVIIVKFVCLVSFI